MPVNHWRQGYDGKQTDDIHKEITQSFMSRIHTPYSPAPLNGKIVPEFCEAYHKENPDCRPGQAHTFSRHLPHNKHPGYYCRKTPKLSLRRHSTIQGCRKWGLTSFSIPSPGHR